MTIERDRVLANHILDAADAIESFIVDVSIVDFAESDLLQSAVVKKFEIIGEAASKLSTEFQQIHSELPWKDIIGMRNVLIHDYMGIDYEGVWDTAKQHIPVLKTALGSLKFSESEIDQL